MKLYEILLRKVGLWSDPKPVATTEKAEEEKIYNPIGCKIGGVVKIDSLDFRDHRFTVREIREYTVIKDGKTHQMTDYVLLARPIGKPDYLCCLRIVPDKDSKKKTTHRALIMTLYDDLAYDKGLHGVVQDTTKKFVIDDEIKKEHAEFWRVNDVGISYTASAKVLSDTNSDGKVSSDEVSLTQIEFWDYSRLTDVEGVEIEEFVFVEMAKSDGWFKIWRGSEVSAERIDVF